jgi:hypothetical protein
VGLGAGFVGGHVQYGGRSCLGGYEVLISDLVGFQFGLYLGFCPLGMACFIQGLVLVLDSGEEFLRIGLVYLGMLRYLLLVPCSLWVSVYFL